MSQENTNIQHNIEEDTIVDNVKINVKEDGVLIEFYPIIFNK